LAPPKSSGLAGVQHHARRLLCRGVGRVTNDSAFGTLIFPRAGAGSRAPSSIGRAANALPNSAG
jgi:hypothetical protein